MKEKRRKADDLTTYRRAVRQHCMDCSGGSIKEAERCRVKSCALWELRPKKTKEAKKASVVGEKFTR